MTKLSKTEQIAVDAVTRHEGRMLLAIEELGWPRHKLYSAVNRARDKGLYPKTDPCPLRKRINEKQIKLGNVQNTTRRASKETRQWLADNVPEGSDIVSFLFAVVQDVIEEEKGQQNAEAEAET